MVKFIHIRECDEDGELLQTGGATIAYTINETLKSIFLNVSKCSVNDQFSRKIGREVAQKRLKDDGPLEILDLLHPVSQTIKWWFIHSNNYVLIRDAKGRYMSTFIEVDENDVMLITHERFPSSVDFSLDEMVIPEDV